jgi:hypothetical protein
LDFSIRAFGDNAESTANAVINVILVTGSKPGHHHYTPISLQISSIERNQVTGFCT